MKEIYFIREDAVCSEFNIPVKSEIKKTEKTRIIKSGDRAEENQYPIYY